MSLSMHRLLMIVAGILFLTAVVFASSDDGYETLGTTAIASNNTPGLAALGFALAGGLSLVAAAIAFLSEIELARTALQSELKQKP